MMDLSTPDFSERSAEVRLAELEEGLIQQFVRQFPDPLAPKTVIIVPSLSLDPEILAKIKGHIHYEERMLCMLMLLRMPRTHIIFLSSMPVDEVIVDYYLHLLPGITSGHARKRLTLLSCYDPSNKPLTEKILQRPRLLERIRGCIVPGSAAHIAGFNITYLEHELSLRLGVPVYGCPASLAYWGSKSGSREIFRRLDMLMPPGYEKLRDMEDVAGALQALRDEHPGLRKAMVKLNDGFSGDGNAIFSFENAGDTIDTQGLRDQLRIVAGDLSYDVFAEKLTGMGGIVEAFVDGDVKASPSVQCRITPLRQASIVSTHDQVLAGEMGQVFVGCHFPASPEYASEIGLLGLRVAEELAREGVMGRLGVDFVSVKEADGWRHYAIEINLRKGGTTHPYLMLQFLTNGHYDLESGTYHMPNGQTRCYFATDGLQSDAYKSLTPFDLIDLAICHDIHYDASVQEGVTFHLIGALPQYGKLGMVCFGSTHERAETLYRRTVVMLETETRF